MKKCSERCKHCALAVVSRSQKKFAPPQTPFCGARDSQNLVSWWWSLPLPTNPVWWGSMHANFVVTDPHTHPQTPPACCKQTGLITIHWSAASMQCKCNHMSANVSTQWRNVSHRARHEYHVLSMSRNVLFDKPACESSRLLFGVFCTCLDHSYIEFTVFYTDDLQVLL